MIRRLRSLLLAAALAGTGLPAVAGDLEISLLDFDDLRGWAADDHAAALAAFRITCKKPRKTALVPAEDWAAPCVAAKSVTDAKAFFETLFQPILLENASRTLFTAYFEPELQGSRKRDAVFKYPVYRLPPDMPKDRKPWKTRAEIEAGALVGKGLELVWLRDPVDAFFLHVQGSGRIRLVEGGSMRLGFGGRNHHKYRSVGKEMLRQGLIQSGSAQAIRAWVAEDPQARTRILHHNPSFIFFREIKGLDESLGPLGAMGKPITTLRSVAVDPAYTPLGAPVWIELDRATNPIRQLMVAQDVGSAVKGPQRADLFFGTGVEAGQRAGRIKHGGRMVLLLPRGTVARLGLGG
ncbi:murein transglycosylase A [Oceanomicrobium pacificus]|uniref:peptidoglycan lytic exotransglycosylase n=1 Tax=Oceanomicrobium pacificus TaxID=2692916 RepID=A0A6B0TU25_9RHOB|nr:MltA domain-containing protein [Oceanomicrobium pacificus]MXU64724.1 murein transglycosylase [Oceanomicrobium pacificus]